MDLDRSKSAHPMQRSTPPKNATLLLILVGWRLSLASRLEAIATRVEAKQFSASEPTTLAGRRRGTTAAARRSFGVGFSGTQKKRNGGTYDAWPRTPRLAQCSNRCHLELIILPRSLAIQMPMRQIQGFQTHVCVFVCPHRLTQQSARFFPLAPFKSWNH